MTSCYKLFIVGVSLMGTAVVISRSPPTEVYLQRNPHSSTYVELQRVTGGVKILKIYTKDDFEDQPPHPQGAYSIITVGQQRIASKITLAQHGMLRESADVVDAKPIADYEVKVP